MSAAQFVAEARETVVQYAEKALNKINSSDERERLEGRMMQRVGMAISEAFIAELERGTDPEELFGALVSTTNQAVLSWIVAACDLGKEQEMADGLIKHFAACVRGAMSLRLKAIAAHRTQQGKGE